MIAICYLDKTLHGELSRIFASHIKNLREQLGINQRELAERLNRDQNLVARIEIGERRVDFVEFYHLMKALEADPAVEAARIAADLNIAVTEKPLNDFLGTRLNRQLKQLKVEWLTDNKARVKVAIQVLTVVRHPILLTRDFLVEIEGGLGPEFDGILVLHIKEGFKKRDGIALMFSKKLNQHLPNGVTFIVEFAKDRFLVDLPTLIKEYGGKQYLPLLKGFKVRTQDQKLRLSISLAAD